MPTQIDVADWVSGVPNGAGVSYLYRADGVKVRKMVTDLSSTKRYYTDYLTGFQYGYDEWLFGGTSLPVLSFFPHSEGYVNNRAVYTNPWDSTPSSYVYEYVYNHTDHLGNVRLSYRKNGTSTQILEENNYYPFGLKHKGYNDNNYSNGYKYKYQGQERQDELGLNWDSFKWRNYDFTTGRFMSIDPLSEKYVYNGVYNFSENCVVVHRELEGLEKVYIFGGADLNGKGISPTTQNIQNSIQQFSTKNNLGFEVKSYNSTPWSPAHEKAFIDIMSNHSEGEKIIIYGYSLGGVGATQLTKLLNTKDVKVDLLVTVDPAFGPFGREISVPDNVKKVDNTYQENRSLIGSKGYPAILEEGNNKTKITNNDITDKTSGKGIDAHGTIDEDTMNRSIQLIEKEMKKEN